MNGARRAVATATVLGITLLTGCAAELPVAEPEPAPAIPAPALSVAQVDSVLSQVHSALVAADEQQDAEKLQQRFTGPAVTVRAAQYRAAAGLGDASQVTEIPEDWSTLVVPNALGWSRAVLAITEQPEQLTSPVLLVLRQQQPRDQYQVWGWARLLPGVQMPPLADPTVGSLPLDAADAVGLQLTPQQVVDAYLDVLANGEESASASAFEADRFRDQYVEQVTNLRTALGERGQVEASFAVAEDGAPFAVATADGGALVVTAITGTLRLSIAEGLVRFPDTSPASVVLGGTDIRQSASLTYTDVVVFYVPPEGSADPVRVLAGEHVLTSGSGV